METREIGTHDGCGGTVFYASDRSSGRRYCDSCGMNSHAWWMDAAGDRRAPESPETVDEALRRNATAGRA